MKKGLRILLLALLLISVLTVPALAWTPTPEIELRILELETPPAVLETVIEGESHPYLSYASAEESGRPYPVYTLYAPLQEPFQIHLVTENGQDFLSPPLTHRTYHTSAILDREAHLVTLRSPVIATVLFFLALLAVPVAAEGLLLLAFRLRPWWRQLLIINLVAQALIAQYYTAASMESSVTAWLGLSLFIGQGLMLFIETGLYYLLLRKEEGGGRKALLFGVAGNAISFLLLAFLLSPLWSMVLRLT